jgi:hypothetical protein
MWKYSKPRGLPCGITEISKLNKNKTKINLFLGHTASKSRLGHLMIFSAEKFPCKKPQPRVFHVRFGTLTWKRNADRKITLKQSRWKLTVEMQNELTCVSTGYVLGRS